MHRNCDFLYCGCRRFPFALDRIRTLAPQHPEWKTRQPLKAVLENDLAALEMSGEKGLVDLVMTSHARMSTGEFESIVTDWLNKAKEKGWIVISI